MQFDSNLNLQKITFDNINKIIPYLTTPQQTTPKAWFNNPLDLIHNEFYYHHIHDTDTILIFKDKLHYGKRILYLMTLPKSNTLTTPEIYALTEQINQHFDIVLPDQELPNTLTKQTSEKPYHEFIYHTSSYLDNLPGQDFKLWRKAYNKLLSGQILIQSAFTRPTLIQRSHIQTLYTLWSQQRNNKGIARHHKWYTPDQLTKLYQTTKSDILFVTYFDKEQNKPLAYDISLKLGNTVYFLDGKIDKSNPLSKDIDRALHIKQIRLWQLNSDNDFYINTGLGDKPYTQDGKTYDLDQHKKLLRPTLIANYNKFRQNQFKLTK